MDNLSLVMDMNCIFLCMRWGPCKGVPIMSAFSKYASGCCLE